jgi:hypothetical protein
MTDFFVGVEDINFSPIGTPEVNAGGALYRPAWARCALACGLPGGFGRASYWRVPSYWGLAVAGAWWWTARIYSLMDTTAAYPFMSFLSAGDVPRLEIWVGPPTGIANAVWQIWKIDAAGNRTYLTTFTGPIGQSAVQKIDIYVNYSTSGSIRVWADSDMLASFDGDVTTDGVATLTGFQIGPYAQIWCSEMLWSDVDTRSIIGVATLAPLANGNTDNWDAGAVSDVNEIVFNDGTVNSSGTAGQLQQYTVAPLPVTQGAVRSVMLSARAAALPGGPQNLDLVLRTNSVDTGSLMAAPGAGFNNGPGAIWQGNPVTGLPWTLHDLISPPFNIGMQSAP